MSEAATLFVDHVLRIDQVGPAARLGDPREDWYSRSGCEYAGELPAAQNIPGYSRVGKHSRHRIDPVGGETVCDIAGGQASLDLNVIKVFDGIPRPISNPALSD